jgi:hypothetical protein
MGQVVPFLIIELFLEKISSWQLDIKQGYPIIKQELEKFVLSVAQAAQ